jgi:hypothetical protein
MRNISFSETTAKFRAHRKHITRRFSLRPNSFWKNLKPNEHLMGIEKGQGLKKGEKVVRLEEITILQVNREPLDEIINNPIRGTPENIRLIYEPVRGRRPTETTLEGFPELSPRSFVNFFCAMNNCGPGTEITRILFDYGRVV